MLISPHGNLNWYSDIFFPANTSHTNVTEVSVVNTSFVVIFEHELKCKNNYAKKTHTHITTFMVKVWLHSLPHFQTQSINNTPVCIYSNTQYFLLCQMMKQYLHLQSALPLSFNKAVAYVWPCMTLFSTWCECASRIQCNVWMLFEIKTVHLQQPDCYLHFFGITF